MDARYDGQGVVLMHVAHRSSISSAVDKPFMTLTSVKMMGESSSCGIEPYIRSHDEPTTEMVLVVELPRSKAAVHSSRIDRVPDLKANTPRLCHELGSSILQTT